MMELEQESGFNQELKKQLMELLIQLRDTEDANLEEGVAIRIDYPDIPNAIFQIVIQEWDEDAELEIELDRSVH